jgi:hypothetical protein
MVLNTKYRLIKMIEEEVDRLTGKTKTVSTLTKTKISTIARQLVDDKEEALKLARLIRWRLNRGMPLETAISEALGSL